MLQTTLRGITWDSPRGYEGLEAATRKYQMRYPTVNIEWDKHSLRHFEAHPIPELAAQYDLIVLDHPFMGDVNQSHCLLGLSAYEQELDLVSLERDTAGISYRIYQYGSELWALPLDAASQTAVYREDLLGDAAPPVTLDEVRGLARTKKLALALQGVHGFQVWVALCAMLGAPPPAEPVADHPFIAEEAGLHALDILAEWASYCPPEALDWNAIHCLETMSERNDLAYSPIIFSYSSYCRAKAGRSKLIFTQIPGVKDARPVGAVIGGTGLAISGKCQAVEEALKFARYLTSAEIQIVMGLHNGQPARKSAWVDNELNRQYEHFYTNTLSTLENGYLRPRFPGYMGLQNRGGVIVEEFLRDRFVRPQMAIQKLNEAHRQIITEQQYDGRYK